MAFGLRYNISLRKLYAVSSVFVFLFFLQWRMISESKSGIDSWLGHAAGGRTQCIALCTALLTIPKGIMMDTEHNTEVR